MLTHILYPCHINNAISISQVIEAHYLFGASYDDIDIVIHPQSIVHSMVETQDTSCIAQLGWADMRLPIVYSVSWPHRLSMPYKHH